MASVKPYIACRVCAQPGRLCTGCRSVGYCSVEHQRLDREQHKPLCHPVRYGESQAVQLDNPLTRWISRHGDRVEEMRRAMATGTLTPDHFVIMLEDRWEQCEADAASIAFYVDRPGMVIAILTEHASKPAMANSAIVPLTPDAKGNNSTYYAQFSCAQMREEQMHNLVMGPAYHPTPFWLRSALRAFHAGTATEADLELLRRAKAKFTAEAAAAREAGFKGPGAE